MSKDYYKILGVEKTASQDEIKKAFRKIAHKHHPDKQGGDELKFKEANEAYQVLSNEQKRAQYDRFGSAGPHTFGGAGQGGFDFSGFQNGNVHFDFGDIDLGDIFGGFGGGRQRQRRGQDLQTRIDLSFSEAVFGTTKKLTIEHNVPCDTCDGSGAKEGSQQVTCPQCKGEGKVQSQMMGIFATVTECPTCHGKGKVPKEKCETCKGAGIRRKKEEVEINIPAGVSHGDTLRVQGKGEAIDGGVPGDLFIQITVQSNATFSRRGIDLVVEQKITMSEAVLGSSFILTMLDDKKLEVKVPAGTAHGTTLRIGGKGIQTERRKGDLLISISITIPKKFSKKAKEAFEILREEGC